MLLRVGFPQIVEVEARAEESPLADSTSTRMSRSSVIVLISAIILSIILLDKAFFFAGRFSVIQAMRSSLAMRVST